MRLWFPPERGTFRDGYGEPLDRAAFLVRRRPGVEVHAASHEVGSQIVAVRVATSEIMIAPRGDDPLLAGGQRVTSALARIGGTTRLSAAERPDASLALAEVRTDSRNWVRVR